MAKKKSNQDDISVVNAVNELEIKYNNLINEIKPKLLTKAQLKRGGSGILSQHLREKGYEAVIPEINDLGKKIGKPKIGLGHLRG